MAVQGKNFQRFKILLDGIHAKKLPDGLIKISLFLKNDVGDSLIFYAVVFIMLNYHCAKFQIILFEVSNSMISLQEQEIVLIHSPLFMSQLYKCFA